MNEVGVNICAIQSGMMAENVFLILQKSFLSGPQSSAARLLY